MRNSSWDHFHYWNTYGSNPLAKYYATEYKSLGDAEAALLQSTKIPKTLLEIIVDFWDFATEWLAKDREKMRMEKYFSEAVDHVDLESRMRNWEGRYKKPSYVV